MNNQAILTNTAPLPIGPYSQAIINGNMLFVSGQIAISPATGELELSSIETETKQVMENLKAVIQHAGFTMQHIVKTSIFLIDMKNFPTVNSIYGTYFPNTPPARETVQVSGLPKNVNVEISAIAIR